MYCPVCLNDSLAMLQRGVVKMCFDGKHKDNSHFLFNILKDTPKQLQARLREKIADYFEFYSGFQNKATIKKFELFTSDFQCKRGCKLDISKHQFSVIGLIFDAQDVERILHEEAEKFKVPIDVELKNIS
jgi:hypothetical protein